MEVFFGQLEIALSSYLLFELPILIIIGGQLILLNIYFDRLKGIPTEEILNQNFVYQFNSFKSNQKNLEAKFFKIAIGSTIIIPVFCIIICILDCFFGDNFQFLIRIPYVFILTYIFYLVATVVGELQEIVATAISHLAYNKKIKDPNPPEDPAAYYNF